MSKESCEKEDLLNSVLIKIKSIEEEITKLKVLSEGINKYILNYESSLMMHKNMIDIINDVIK
jgi:hypothetical protein